MNAAYRYEVRTREGGGFQESWYDRAGHLIACRVYTGADILGHAVEDGFNRETVDQAQIPTMPLDYIEGAL